MLELLSERSLQFNTKIVQLFLTDSKTTLGNLGDQQAMKHRALSISGKGLKDSPNNILSLPYLKLKASQKLSSVTLAMQNPSEENTVTSLPFKNKDKGVLKSHHFFKSQRMVFYDWICDSLRQLYPESFHHHLRSGLCSSASHLCWELRHPTHFGGWNTSFLSNMWQQTPESGTRM